MCTDVRAWARTRALHPPCSLPVARFAQCRRVASVSGDECLYMECVTVTSAVNPEETARFWPGADRAATFHMNSDQCPAASRATRNELFGV